VPLLAQTPTPVTPAGFAHDDTAAANARRPLRLSPLDNDGADGVTLDPSTLEIVDPADHAIGRPGGTRGTLAGSGIIAYHPEHGFVGVDTITYRVCTTTGVCETATIVIAVPA
jgi:hypothetical protein